MMWLHGSEPRRRVRVGRACPQDGCNQGPGKAPPRFRDVNLYRAPGRAAGTGQGRRDTHTHRSPQWRDTELFHEPPSGASCGLAPQIYRPSLELLSQTHPLASGPQPPTPTLSQNQASA